MIKPEGIGKRIRNAREKKKMTQEQLGSKIGISKSAISKIECGKQKEPNLDLINSIARELGVRAEYLLGADNLIDREIEFVRDLLKKFLEFPQQRISRQMVSCKMRAIFFCKALVKITLY